MRRLFGPLRGNIALIGFDRATTLPVFSDDLAEVNGYRQ